MKEDLNSKVTKEEKIFEGKYLGMKYVEFTIGDKSFPQYESIYRTTSIPGRIDSIDIIPVIKYKDRKSELLMNVEFRAPVHGYTLEFPTGMCESDDYQDNARRQMLQETGYLIDKIVKTPCPVIYYDPWKSNENTFVFLATINGDDPNSFKGQQLQHDQDIRSVKFVIDDKLLQNIVSYSSEHKLHLESKVYSLCLGLWLRNNMSALD